MKSSKQNFIILDNRLIILIAQVISLVFSPFYMPTVGLLLLFTFSYLKDYDWSLKIEILLTVYFFTVLLPIFLISIYRKINGWSRYHLGQRVNRFVPYIISIISYTCLLYQFYYFHVPRFAVSIIVAALLLQIICAFLNNWFKISVHAAASGAVVGSLFAFSLIFNFNPLYWLCLAIMLSGLVGTARLILRQHSLLDIGLGTLIGVICGFVVVLLV